MAASDYLPGLGSGVSPVIYSEITFHSDGRTHAALKLSGSGILVREKWFEDVNFQHGEELAVSWIHFIVGQMVGSVRHG
jgi:hypothetical protein